jgi:hypothetical protein
VQSSPQVVAAHVPSTSAPSPSASLDGSTGAWPLPARWLDHVRLETARATLVYWLGVALVVSSVFVPRLLPCVDYPQHLALADIAHRLQNPAAAEHATHQLNYFTYNGAFHLLVAKLSSFMSIELAGRLVIAVSLLTIAAAVVALLRVLRRPLSYAALFTPVLFSFSLGWGFVNYVLGSAIALVALVIVARSVLRPSIAHALALTAVGLACAFAHVLAMLILCLAAAALAPELAWRSTQRRDETSANRATSKRARAAHIARATLRTAIALLPLLVGCAFCVKVYLEQYDWDPNMYRDPTVEGTAPPVWQKLFFFSAFSTDMFMDRTDQVLLIAGVVILVAIFIIGRRQRRMRASESALSGASRGDAADSPALVLPFVALAGAYFATPMVLIGTHLIFPRLAQWVMLAAILFAPRLSGALGARISAYCLALGAVVGANLVLHTSMFAMETNDASRVIDDLPEGRSATSVVWEPGTLAFRNGTMTHLAAYYAARKHGLWAFSFARYLSVPVRFRPGKQPAWPTKGWEFTAADYNPRCKYARTFDLVIVKAPPDVPTGGDGEKTLRHRMFGKDENNVVLLSHHGAYWAFDTKALTTDGTL